MTLETEQEVKTTEEAAMEKMKREVTRLQKALDDKSEVNDLMLR